MKIAAYLAFSILTLIPTARAAEWTTLADCATPDGTTGGGGFYTDGSSLILQVSTQTTSLDEYRAPTSPAEIAQLRTDLAAGLTRVFNLKRTDSTTVGGITTDAALLALSGHVTPSSAVNSYVGRRSQVMALTCDLPAPAPQPSPIL